MTAGRELADPKACDVFLAHAGPDLQPARQLHDLLEKDGYTVFLDGPDLQYGDDWDRVLPERQRNALVTLVLVSGNTENAYYQRAEIAAAINMAREDTAAHRVIPIYLGDPSRYPRRVPYGLELKHSIHERESGGIPGLAQAISETLAKIKGDAKARIEQREVAVDLSHNQSQWDELANELDRRGLSDRLHRPGSLEAPGALDGVSVMILPLPRRSEFSTTEVEYVRSWVRGGGGLFLLGYYTAGLHHENNVNHLAGVFDASFREDLLMPPGSSDEQCRAQVFGGSEYALRVATSGSETHPLFRDVGSLAVQSACSIDAGSQSPEALVVEATDAETWTPTGTRSAEGYLRIIRRYERSKTESEPRCAIAARTYFEGRIVMAGSWKILTLNEAGNRKFVDNALRWLGEDRSSL